MRINTYQQLLKIGVLVLITLILCPSAWAETYKIKFGIVTQNDPIYMYMVEFKKKIEEKTSGRIKVDTYPSGQLGSIPRLIEGAQMGTIEMILFPTGFYKGVNPAFQVMDAPGLFDNVAHAQASCTDPDFREPFLNLASSKGLVGVSLWVYGPTSYATMKPINTLADFKGRKIRVLASKVETGLMESIGATGVPMPFTEIIPGLQRNVIDGVRSSHVVLAGIKLFTLVKHITMVEDSMIFNVSMISKRFLDKLPDDLRLMVLETGREMEDHMFEVIQDYNEKAIGIWQAEGAEVIRLNEEERNVIMSKGANIAEDVLRNEKGSTAELYENLKKVVQKHKGTN
jgi:C4-dicarboxylate-binding protein DctP